MLLSGKPFNAMMCGRGSGKTLTLAALMLRSIKDGDDHIHTGPTHSQASEAIDQLREVLASEGLALQRTAKDNGYHCKELGDGRIRCFSGVKENNLRSKNCNILTMDEAAYCTQSFFKNIAYPCLRKGSLSGRTQAYLASSPLGPENWFSDYVKQNDGSSDFLFVHSTYRDIAHLLKPDGSPALTENWMKGIELLYKDEDQLIVDRELNGLVVSNVSDGLFVNLLKNLVPNDKPVTYGRICVGVDIADEGDYTSATARTDNNILLIDKEKTNPDTLRPFLQKFIARLGKKPDIINYDASGLGRYAKASFDGLANMVHPIKFGESAIRKDLYEKRRAELYDDFANFLRDKVYVCPHAMPFIRELKDDLKYVRRLPDNNKMCLIPKKDIKKLIKRSPDVGDGTVLAFAKTNAQNYESIVKKAASMGHF